MSGLMLTFARAVHVGDFARIGEIEGTILQVGALATKVRTPTGEEVTIPNALVVSQTVTNYSTVDGASAVYVPTTVRIGYDTPWRQVEALLLAAARDTPGVRPAPPPVVRRLALDDFAVKYALLVAPEDPHRRVQILDALHARILDAFNEHGVQIMTPHYENDPAGPKLVPRSRWHEPPATPAALPAGPVAVRAARP
jgi:small-conductance mechanosensitive channel